MNRWPAWYRHADNLEGTCYIDQGRFLPILKYFGYSGQAWKFQKQFSTYQPNKKILFKNLDRLATRDREDWTHIMGSCMAAGLNPPTSFTDIFSSITHFPFPRVTTVSPFIPFSFGGWQEVFEKKYKGRVYCYDINKAYRWSACQGLPIMQSAFQSKKWDLDIAIYSVTLKEGSLPYALQAGQHIITSEERDFFKIKPESILYGIGFKELLSLGSTFQTVDKYFPFCRDRICRAFWGIWNTQRSVEQCSWASGEKHRFLKNPHYNPVWAAFITSRVKIRLARYLSNALHIFVDSVITPEQIEVGTDVGDFRLKGTYDGWWAENVNVWGERDLVVKHAGIPGEGFSKLKMISRREYLKLRSDHVR